MIIQVLFFYLAEWTQVTFNITMFPFPLYRVPQVKMVVQVQQGPLETEGPQESWEHQGPRVSMYGSSIHKSVIFSSFLSLVLILKHVFFVQRVTQERSVNRDP